MTDKKIRLYGNPDSLNLFIQPVDAHGSGVAGTEAEQAAAISGGDVFCIAEIRIDEWNKELTPWKAEAVYGAEDFGDGARETLGYILDTFIPAFENEYPAKDRRYFLCGYSLAGLFSLWAAYQTDIFHGVAAVSPSVWYKGWINFSENNEIKTHNVYLSLGDREEKTKNPVMAAVGNAIRRQERLLTERGINTVLEWNPGNHFAGSAGRTAKGIAWLLGVK